MVRAKERWRVRNKDEVALVLERTTGLKFTSAPPVDDGETEESLWCISCRRANDESPFVSCCWEDLEGSLWLESPHFADAVAGEWSERDTLIEKAMAFDYAGFGRAEVEKRYQERFGRSPARVQLYRNYEQSLAARQGVDLHLRFEGDIGILLLSYGIRVAKKGELLKEAELKKALSVMERLRRQIDYEEDENNP